MVTRSVFAAVLAASGSLWLSAAYGQPGQFDPRRHADAEVVARTMAVVDWAMQRDGAVALSVGVARDGRVLVDEGVGTADLEFDVPADRETTFRIGSVTKQFTAASIMKLVERDELGLDDDIGQYVPEFNTGGRVVTVRQLLNHTSGVPSYTSQPDFFPKGSALDLTHEELLAYIDGVPFVFEPGEGWEYSNSGYYLLGMIIEAVDGRTYGNFVQDEFFDPLGLTRTRYGSERDIIPNRAQGYDYDPASQRFFNDALISMNTPGAAGALLATAGDLVRWQIALRGGEAIRPESYQAMITSTVPTGQGPQRYGFGLMLNEAGGQTTITHTGGIPGFNSVLTTLPDADMHVAVISSSNALPSALVAQNIVRALTSAEAPELLAPRTTALPGSEDAVRRLIGELARGEPDYERLSPQMAEVTRAQLPVLQQRMQELGSIEAISFLSVGPGGQDMYRVDLENGAVMFQIVVDADGTVTGAGLAPAPPE